MKVMVGGTFDLLHTGHRLLLSKAFETAAKGGHVFIGLSSDEFASNKSHPVRRYEVRLAELTRWIESMNFEATYEIEPLFDKFGRALTLDFDALIVSYETFRVGEEINEKRKALNKSPVELYKVSCVLADDGKAISSTRIYKKEINRYGRREEDKGLFE